MSKMSYAFAMLAPAGSAATRLGALGVIAAAGSLAAAPAAQATELMGTWTSQFGFDDTFYVQSNGGVADGSADDYYLFDTQFGGGTAANFIDFAITGDSYGYTAIVFGDGTTGFAGSDGYVGIGGAQSGPSVSIGKKDSLVGPIYNGNTTGFVLQPGVYTGDYYGSTLTLTAVPEPDAWALLVAGAALAGGAARLTRRRRQSAELASASA